MVGGIRDIACAKVAPALVRHDAQGLVHLATLEATAEGEAACRAFTANLEARGKPAQEVLKDPQRRAELPLDPRAGRPLELEAIDRVPLARSARHGVAMPETPALLRGLERLTWASAGQV